MIEILRCYANFIRKYINKPKDIYSMHKDLQNGFYEYKKNKDINKVHFNNRTYTIHCIKTPVFKPNDSIMKFLNTIKDNFSSNDIITIAESVIAITQGRAYTLNEIKLSSWAYILYPWVSNVTYGTGLGMPETMQCALDEAGLKLILKATLYGAFDRLRKKHGGFYKIAGKKIKSIDFKKNHPVKFKNSNNYIVLSPHKPFEFCKQVYNKFKIPCGIIDANNVSVDVLGYYPKSEELYNLLLYAMKGNPAGQEDEKTPIVILKKYEKN